VYFMPLPLVRLRAALVHFSVYPITWYLTAQTRRVQLRDDL
jgi:hypothetical protein